MKCSPYLFVLLLLFSACGIKKKKIVEDNQQVNPERVVYPQAEIGDFEKKTDAFQISEMKLNGNYLEITVSYSGGCEKHDFRLIGSKDIGTNTPPVRKMQLIHNAHGDLCKSIVQEKLIFSVSNLSQHYDPGNKIILSMENFKPDIPYTYE